ncbi:MAG: DUF4837 family protein [Cytophagales bacterium]|nr:DUF4837 family protein [Cytophagales bacterium]
MSVRFLFFVLVIGLWAACSSDTRSLSRAVGQAGDIYVIIDSAQSKGKIGFLVDSILSADMPGLPRKEPLFKIRWIDARRFNYVIKERRNLLYVMTLDQRSQGAAIIRRLFTPESITQIKTDSTQFMTTASDVFARGQEVMYLFGKDESTLAANLRKDGSRLVSFFNQRERERLTQSLFKSGQVKGITEILTREYQCSMQIPFGFKLADKAENFLWIRQINPKDDKDVFIARKPYTSQADFKRENLIKFRDQVCKKYLFEDPDKSNTYLLTETSIPFLPVTADTINFNGRFAIQLRGLWRSNTMGMGGPFLGFALVDEPSGQFYYVEGFTISPGKDQREIMRELETILYTFQPSGGPLPKQAQ